MKKVTNTHSVTNNLINEDDFQHILIKIIDEVIVKRKEIHQKYHKLIQRVSCCEKSLNKRTQISKYLMARVIRESDKAFDDAQNIAKHLCPTCKKRFESYNSYSDKLH